MSIENDKIFRENVINKFNEMFKKKTATNIEKGIYNFTIKQAKKLIIVRKWENKYFVNIYVNRWRSLYLNFKNNKSLVEKIKTKQISVKELSEMRHQELCPEKWKKLIDAKIKRDKNLTSVNLSAATDEFKCYRCKKSKCTYYQLQTRSADEPMTTFITCLVCGNRWKC
jgi:transcription elongation factor S-II|tara:strand:- start:9060 stop:9566 length:507 start_codon:yes stop_codon:yes gene_type:complete